MMRESRLLRALLISVISVVLMHHHALAATVPGCHANVARYDISVPGHPFKVADALNGAWAFASVNSSAPTSPNGIAVLRCQGGRYKLSHFVSLEAAPTGFAMTHDGTLLVVADDGFVAFVDTAAAIAGQAAISGYIQDLEGAVEDNDPGSVYVNVSPDDRFAFVSDEQNQSITVIDLVKARASHFARTSIVGQIPVANAPIALTFSADGRYLFTTSEIARKSYKWPIMCKPEGAPQTATPENPAGAILTVDVLKAETDPAHSVIGKTPSDCSPVRMALSPDGSTVWVSNRGSNSVTVFATGKLIFGDAGAKIAGIQVGSNPVAIAATADGRYVLAANTNRFGPGGTGPGTLSVIDASTHAVVGTIEVGIFPREFSQGLGTTLFLANDRSDTITVFDTSRLNELIKR